MKNRVKVTIAALAVGLLTVCTGITGYAVEDQGATDKTNMKYSVTYDYNNGSDNEVVEFPKETGSLILGNSTPTKEGYELTGWWYVEDEYHKTEEKFDKDATIKFADTFKDDHTPTLVAEWTQVVKVTLDENPAGTVVAGHTYVVTPAASNKLTLDKWVVNDSTDDVPLGDDKSGSITVKPTTVEKHVINIDNSTGFGITSENPNANFVSYWSPKDEYYLVEVTNKTGHPLKFNHKTIENNATAGVELFGIEKGFPEKTGDNFFTILNRGFDYYIKDQAGDYTPYDGHNVKFYSVTLNAENVKRNIAVKYKQIDGVNYTYTVELNKEVNYNSSAISPQDLLNITVGGGIVEAQKDGFTKYRWTYSVKDINGKSTKAESIPSEAWVGGSSENILENKFNYSFPYYVFEFEPVWQGDVKFSLDIPTGESATTPDAIEGVDVGTTITLPKAPEIEGYTFNGWKPNVSTDTESYKPESSYKVTSANVTFTGSWTANTYSITWNAENGETALDPTNVTYKNQVKLSIPEKTGYTFTGWKSDVEGDNTLYNEEKPFTMPSHDVTMTAQWKINTYTVTYDGNGTTIGVYKESDSVEYGKNYTIQQVSGITPTRYGYKFLGWRKDNEGDLLKAGGSFTMPAKDVTLVAQWERKSPDLGNKGKHDLSNGVRYTYNGAFRIKGDPSNYQDKITFYVPKAGEYTFE